MEKNVKFIFLYDVGKYIYKSNVFSKRLLDVLFLSYQQVKCYIIYRDGIMYDITETRWPTDMTFRHKMKMVDKSTATMMLLKSREIGNV